MTTTNHQTISALYNLTLRKFEAGVQVHNIFVQCPGYLPVPRVGEYVETNDTVDGLSISGTVTSVKHRNGVVPGPIYISHVEVDIE